MKSLPENSLVETQELIHNLQHFWKRLVKIPALQIVLLLLLFCFLLFSLLYCYFMIVARETVTQTIRLIQYRTSSLFWVTFLWNLRGPWVFRVSLWKLSSWIQYWNNYLFTNCKLSALLYIAKISRTANISLIYLFEVALVHERFSKFRN